MEEKIKIGTIRNAWEIGRKNRSPYIWSACEICGEARWVRLEGGQAISKRCVKHAKYVAPNPCTNPKLGDIRYGKDIGKTGISTQYIWAVCEICGEGRWVTCKNKEAISKRCVKHINYVAPNPCPNPKLGDIRYGRDIGKTRGMKYIWSACIDCGKERWIEVKKGRPTHSKCRRCIGYKSAISTLPCPNPQKGDIRHGKDIGKSKWFRYIWYPCEVCGKERWVAYAKGKSAKNRCLSCTKRSPANPCPNPKEGDIRLGRDIGKGESSARSKYIYHKCIDCDTYSWVRFDKGQLASIRCNPCAVAFWNLEHGHYKEHNGKKARWSDGYVDVLLKPDDFFYPMAKKGGWVREHRLVMAQSLGRCLQPWEIVHHKDGDRSNNDINNLELADSVSAHIKGHSKGYKDGYKQGLLDGRDKQVQELKEQIVELKDLIENQTKQVKLLQWQNNNRIGDI